LDVAEAVDTTEDINESQLSNETADINETEAAGVTAVPELSQFVVLSTPGATVAGQNLNPLARLPNQQIVERVSERTGNIDDIESEGNRTTQSLGESRDVEMFSGTTEIEGQEVDVQMHVASFEHEGDVIIVFAVHPEQINESDNVDEMLSGLEHSGN